jgi:hypothetical protein
MHGCSPVPRGVREWIRFVGSTGHHSGVRKVKLISDLLEEILTV